MSRQAMLEEWNNSEKNPVQFCKFQGQDSEDEFNLAKENFAIVIQNPFQRMMAQTFAHKGVCVDSTHGTTAYDFLLTSVVVLDEFGEGVPIAWLLSNYEDFTHMCLFFNILKRNCGVLSPHWIMSHMASQYYNAWVAVMGGQPKHLLCTWHFDRACLTELHAKVKDTVAAEIYKMLIVLQQKDWIPLKITFANQTHSFLNSVWNLQSILRKSGQQGQNCGLIAMEKMLALTQTWLLRHSTFHKYGCLKRRINERVDTCLHYLVQFAKDKSFDRIIKLAKGKQTSQN